MRHLFGLVKPQIWQAVLKKELKRVVESHNVNVFQMVFKKKFKSLNIVVNMELF